LVTLPKWLFKNFWLIIRKELLKGEKHAKKYKTMSIFGTFIGAMFVTAGGDLGTIPR
jgi:hypothetical protein